MIEVEEIWSGVSWRRKNKAHMLRSKAIGRSMGVGPTAGRIYGDAVAVREGSVYNSSAYVCTIAPIHSVHCPDRSISASYSWIHLEF